MPHTKFTFIQFKLYYLVFIKYKLFAKQSQFRLKDSLYLNLSLIVAT